MIIYRIPTGLLVDHRGTYQVIGDLTIDDLFLDRNAAMERITEQLEQVPKGPRDTDSFEMLPPIGSQEVWAAGVTYFRSKTARMEESKEAGGSDFYEKVYHANRPELFLKATPHRVVGHKASMHLRSDSHWNVPEPELTVAIDRSGQIIGYTIGNDLSSRDIEGENPLYLPQAKIFNDCCSLGPGILIQEEPLSKETRITLEIERKDQTVWSGATRLSEMKQTIPNIISYLFRDNSFPHGCFLLTGTGIVPPDDFTLKPKDHVAITIDGIGTLVNYMA